MTTQTSNLTIHSGNCHCSAVCFEIKASAILEAIRCNCSICLMCGFLHLIIPKPDFKLLRGRDKLSEYRFNTQIAQHLFCKICGIKSFYIPRSHPDSYSINVNCLNKKNIQHINLKSFDGENWENAITALHKTHTN